MRTDPMNTTLVLVGLLILCFNTLIGAVRLRRAQAYAGLFSVALAVVACALIAIGITRAAFFGTAPSYGAALTGGLFSLPGSGGGVTHGSDAHSASAIPPILIAGVGLLIAVAALVIYRFEARRPSFKPDRSSGLLNIGVGLFTLVAALVIPLIPFQLKGSPAFSPTSAPVTPGLTPQTSMPSATLMPSATPRPSATATRPDTTTPLPSLTPTESETPIILYTLIPYTSTYSARVTGHCTVTATTALNLRGDPSVDRAAIGRIFAGSLLNVTGRSVDKQWWRVISTDGGIQIEGWVSGDYISADSSCDGVPVVDSAGGLLAPTSTQTPTATTVGGITVTPAPCTLITTAAANLRPDPSSAHTPVAVIPAKTVFAPFQRSADRQWWRVVYGGQEGWISASAVIASTACAGVLPITPTPAP